MLQAERLRRLMSERRLSQSELARRVGVTQTTIRKLTSGAGYGSKHLHRIARELGTTPAYLIGETDDPEAGAPPPPPLQLVHVMLPVALPSERALERMFEGLLRVMPPDAGLAEQARLLAQRLPIGLSQLRDLLPEQPTAAPARERETAEALATPDRAQRP